MLNSWEDLWFNNKKDYGNVVLTKLGYNGVVFDYNYRLKTVNNLIKKSNNNTDTYISLNSFKNGVRRSGELAQIRNIGIDLDFYKMDKYSSMTNENAILEVFGEVIKHIGNGDIPGPNMVTFGHGVQLIWTIKNGLPASMAWATKNITANFVNKLSDLGADPKCTDVTRLFRVPGSVNSRNNSKIKFEIWNNNEYDFSQLSDYIVDNFSEEDRETKLIGNRVKTNKTRLEDFEKLANIRGIKKMIGYRNEWLFWYGFHYLLSKNISQGDFEDRMNTIQDKYIPGLSSSEIKNTLKSCWREAGLFLKYYKENRNVILYNQDDGIVKPEKVKTIIRDFDITEEEQLQLVTFASDAIKLERKRELEKNRWYDKGHMSMDQLKKTRKVEKEKQVSLLKGLFSELSNSTKKHIAWLLKISTRTLRRTEKIMGTDSFIDINRAKSSELLLFLKNAKDHGLWFSLSVEENVLKNDYDIVSEFVFSELFHRLQIECT